MTAFSFADVVLLRFPFTDPSKTKKRPALILYESEDGDVIVARITSKIHNSEFDIEIDGWKKCGLKLPSVIRLHKLATLDSGLVEEVLGKLDKSDIRKIKERISGQLRKWA